MYLEVQIPENGGKKVFSYKQTNNKVALMFWEVKLLR